MDKLSTYVAVIHGQAGPLQILRQSTERTAWQDQGVEVTREVTDYRFDNGVEIRRTVEQDDFPCELVCAECWITYEVTGQLPSQPAISPARKVFENACREAFWLKYFTA